jgi:predicted RNA binding protein YcfA (HicA-like mRNA interferase family)
MPKLPVISGRDAVKALGKAGFEPIKRRGKGSHMVVARRDPVTIITIPDHRELDRGTLRSIIRQAGLTVEQFVDLLD